MKKYLTRTNIGWAMTLLFCLPMAGSIFGKLSKSQETMDMFASHNIADWITIIGIGEIIALVLFIVPQTMRLGAMMLAAYFGGAIMFHMAHPMEDMSSFFAPTVFLFFVLTISWVRGMDLIFVRKKEAFHPEQ